ncbi:MAG: addiction module antidote protein [Pseudomonadota bacterium]
MSKAKKRASFRRWDPADHLKSKAEIAEYLTEIFNAAGDDPAVISAALGDVARAYGVAKLAKATGLTREGLYKALSKDGNPSLGTLLKVAKAFGVRFAAEVSIAA